MVQQQTTRGFEIEKFISHRSWRKYTAHLEGPHEAVQAECPERETGPGVHVFIRVHGWSALGSPDYSWIGQSNQKIGVLVSSMGILSKHTGAERQGRLLILRNVGEVI